MVFLESLEMQMLAIAVAILVVIATLVFFTSMKKSRVCFYLETFKDLKLVKVPKSTIMLLSSHLNFLLLLQCWVFSLGNT
ncbi:hypothetical protein BVRB_2g039130 [Beta vulgaris subsp. vulgaris]|nr:hypothetical protein BVRB_2g039130 [Beta vulgaris subsp. vulgaris]